eukprot:COSAG02_NODE_2_length_75708_cov_87.013953_3_plen_62_part_00
MLEATAASLTGSESCLMYLYSTRWYVALSIGYATSISLQLTACAAAAAARRTRLNTQAASA